MNVYKYYVSFIISVTLLCSFSMPLYASSGKGNIRRLKGLADSMGRMDAHSRQEGLNYKKAEAFLSSADIQKGISGKDIIKICGEPVAKADNGLRWVYKPPTSTFSEGEKIYFYLDKEQKLAGWHMVYQK